MSLTASRNARVRVPINEMSDVIHFRNLIGDPLSKEERRDLERLMHAKEQGIVWSRRTSQGIRHYAAKLDVRDLILGQ